MLPPCASVISRAMNKPRPKLVLGRGSQYCSHEYRALVAQFGMQASMSRRGNCYENAPIESFWGTLKNELIHHRRYATREQARCEIAEYIDLFYNRQRRQARLGYLSPAASDSNTFGKGPLLNTVLAYTNSDRPQRNTGLTSTDRDVEAVSKHPKRVYYHFFDQPTNRTLSTLDSQCSAVGRYSSTDSLQAVWCRD